MTQSTTASGAPRQPVGALRRRTAAMVVGTVFAMVAGLVFVAVSAEGREVTRASSNDGGAWLVNRELGVVVHRNRAVSELTAFLRVADSPQADVLQAEGIVLVHDAGSNLLFEVDERSFIEDLEPTVLSDGSQVIAVDGAVLVVQNDPLTLWRIEATDLGALKSIDDLAPIVTLQGPGRVAATNDGTVALVTDDNHIRWWTPSQGLSEAIDTTLVGGAADLTIVGSSAALVVDSGDIAVVGRQSVEAVLRWAETAPDVEPIVVLQQPDHVAQDTAIEPARRLVGVTERGQIIEIDVSGAEPAVDMRAGIDGTSPLPPIVHRGCIYALVTAPPTFATVCDTLQTQPLERAGSQLRLRLVNGWVWVNDLADGGTWTTDESFGIEKLDDWGLVIEALNDDDAAEGEGQLVTEVEQTQVEDPDAEGEVHGADAYDKSQANEPPVAVNDEVSTRVDRVAVVDVLANDTDPNNDVLVVTAVELSRGEATISVSPGRDAIQVIPAPGFAGLVQLEYSISDGRSAPVPAFVTVDVLPVDKANTAPIATTDVVATAPGHTSTVNVMENDRDPDGDALALVWIEAPSGTLRWAPNGQVTFTPDTTTDSGWVEIPYGVADDLGAETTGLLRVEIRDRGANQEPDARNDFATTVVRVPVVINLLANDGDPDGDLLIVGSRPELIEPAGASVRTSITPDGEFTFDADQPGTYIFTYTVTDSAVGGSERDTARIRVDVSPADRNTPPVAVRDDVVVPVGDTRLVYALENDGDFDGDVIGIVDWQPAPGLVVREAVDESGIYGFWVTVGPDAPSRPSFSYWISDGKSEPVAAPVVVAVVEEQPRNQPPFATDDVVEARVGSTIEGVDVLANDFDPEGAGLRVLAVGNAAGVALSIGADGQSVRLSIGDEVTSSFTFSYDIADDVGNRAAASVRVQLIGDDAPNRPPVALADHTRTTSAVPVEVEVLLNDSDPDNDALVLTGIAEQPQHGTASTNAEGRVIYTSDPTFTGTDRLRYSIVDARGDKATGDVYIGVMDRTEANLPPTANDDAYFLAGDPVETPLDVLANDFDPENDPLQVVNVRALGPGAVHIDRFGRVVFVPPRSLAEETTMTFSYTIVDTAGNQASAEIAVTMEAFDASLQPTPTPVVAAPTPTPTPLAEPTPTPDAQPTPTPTPRPPSDNQPPVAVADQRGPVKPGTRVDVEVLRNDFDPDGERDELRIVGVGRGATIEGSVVVIEAGESTVTTTYTIEDADGAQATGEIVVLVTENQPPQVLPLEVSTTFETEISLDLAEQASDPDGDRLFFVCCTAIRGGSIAEVEASAGVLSLVFTPDDGFHGPAGFAYSVDDQNGHQVAGSVAVLVSSSGNQRPVALGDTIQVPQGSTVAVGLERLGSDPDPDDLLNWSIVERVGAGVDIELDGATVLVTAARDARPGSDAGFVYKVSDGTLDATARVAIRVIESGNTPPLVTDTTIRLAAATSATVNLAVLTRESDPGDSVTWTATPPPGSKLAVSLDGSRLQVAAPAEAVGVSEEIVFTATDTRGGTASGTITVSVVDPTAPPPVAVDDEARGALRAVIEVRVLENDVDPLGKGLTLVSASSSQGTATVEGDRVRFLPAEGVAQAVVRYTMRDASNRQASGTLTVETVGAPEQPAPARVTVDAGQATLSWSTPQANGSPVTGYVLTKNGAETRQVDLRNSYTWAGLTNGLTYTFTVTAQSAVGDSPPSEPSLPVIPNQVPEAPAPPTVDPVPDGGALLIGWDAPRNDGSEILGYEVEIGGSTSGTIAVGTDRSYAWQGLTNGLEYTFRVRARNAAGFGPFSAPSSSEHPASPPGAPVIGTTERGTLSGSLTVNWGKPTDGGSAIIEYEVRSLNKSSATVSGADTTSYNWSNLPNGTEISFQVRARNRAGWGPYSSTSAGVAPCGVPGAPTITSAVRGDRHVDLGISAPNSNGCPITGYSVTANTGLVRTSPGASFEFDGLTNGNSYTFTVRADNVMGSGPASTASSPVIPAGPPICSSSTLNAQATAPGTVELQWPGAIDNGSPITGYTLSDGSTNRSSGGNDLTVSGLPNGTTYTFSVRANNDVGTSPVCGSAAVTTWDGPTPVSASLAFLALVEELQATVSGGRSPNTPITTWTARFVNQATGLTEANVAGVGVLPPSIASSIQTDGTYRFELEVCNIIGCVTTTACCEVVTLVAPPDKMDPPLMRYENTDWSRFGVDVRAAFTPPADNGAAITEYVWESRWHGDSNSWHYDVPGGRSPDLDVLVKFWPGYSSWPGSMNSGQDWVFSTRVAAVNSEGQGEWSEWAEVRAIARPPFVGMVTGGYGRCPSGPTSLRCHQMEITVHGFAGGTATSFWPDNAGTGGNGFYPFGCAGGTFATDPGGSFSGPVNCWFRDDWAGELTVDVGGVRSDPFWIEPNEPIEICGGNTGIICR